MEKAANVSLDVIDRICNHLNCRVEKALNILKKAREKQLSNEKNHLLKRMDELVNIVAQNNQKQEEINAKIQVLNKRLFKTESEIERLTKQ